MLNTAHSSHSYCFICGANSKRRTLHQINKEAIITAFMNQSILIKEHARCCSNHLEKNGLIKFNEVPNIRTALIEYDRSIIYTKWFKNKIK